MVYNLEAVDGVTGAKVEKIDDRNGYVVSVQTSKPVGGGKKLIARMISAHAPADVALYGFCAVEINGRGRGEYGKEPIRFSIAGPASECVANAWEANRRFNIEKIEKGRGVLFWADPLCEALECVAGFVTVNVVGDVKTGIVCVVMVKDEAVDGHFKHFSTPEEIARILHEHLPAGFRTVGSTPVGYVTQNDQAYNFNITIV